MRHSEPSQNTVIKIEIALHVETGNIIYREFADPDEAIAFIRRHADDPARVLAAITPAAERE
jgi:hypothetical protein